MASLLRTEWLKINKYPIFWLLIGLCILSYPGVNYIFLNIYHTISEKKSGAGQVFKMFIGNPFSFPEVWRTTAYFSSMVVFIPAVVVIMLITNEYTYRTNRQNIIDGWSRNQFILAKLLNVVLITIIFTILYTIVTIIIGNTNTSDINSSKWEQSSYIWLFALQTFSQLSIAFLVGLLVKKSFIAMAIFLFYSLVAEPIAVNLFKYKFLKNDMGQFFPLEISDRILPPPAFLSRFDESAYKASLEAVSTHTIYTLILIMVTWLINYIIYFKRDL